MRSKRNQCTWCYVDVCARRLPPCAPCVGRASFPVSVVPPARGCSPYFRSRDYFRYDLPPSRPVCSWGRPIAKVERAKPHRLSELVDTFSTILIVCFYTDRHSVDRSIPERTHIIVQYVQAHTGFLSFSSLYLLSLSFSFIVFSFFLRAYEVEGKELL